MQMQMEIDLVKEQQQAMVAAMQQGYKAAALAVANFLGPIALQLAEKYKQESVEILEQSLNAITAAQQEEALKLSEELNAKLEYFNIMQEWINEQIEAAKSKMIIPQPQQPQWPPGPFFGPGGEGPFI